MALLITGPFSPYLEERIAGEIASAKRDDPFRPLAVIVPTRALKRRLQSILARDGCWINVHFFTFFELSLWLLKAAGREVRPTVPGAVLSLLLKQVIESDLPQNEHTAYFLSYDSSLKRLLGLFSRFTSYRVTPPANPIGIEKTVFAIYQSFCDRKRVQGIRDSDDLIDEAARLFSAQIPPDVPRSIFLYGFYDLNPVQADIIRSLDALCDLTIVSAGGFSAGAEEFFERTAQFYRDLSGTTADSDGAPPTEVDSIITPIARELFSVRGTPRREAGGSIELVTSSGVRGEARAVALSIIGLMEKDPSLEWREIAVTMRERADYTGALAEAFAEYSIPAVFDGGQPLSSIPEVGYFLVLISALRRGLVRDDVLFLFSSALFAWPSLTAADELRVRDNAYLLAEFAGAYRIISGTREWESAFSRHRDRPTDIDLTEDDPDGTGTGDRNQSMTRYIRTVQPIVGGFLSALAKIPAEAPPAEYRDRLTSLIDTYIRPSHAESPGIGYLGEILGTLTAVSSIRSRITRDDCLAILEDAISQSNAPSPDDIDGVFVSDVMGARLLPRKVVFLMGMNERVFPHVAGRDPFLADETGAALGLRTAASRLMEDRTLFALTVACARDLIVISRQRSDDAGRTVSPSPFLEELLSRITIDGDEVPLTAGSAGRDYPRITAADRELSRHREQDIRAFLCLGWPDERDLRAVRGVVSDTPFLKGGLTAIDERASNRPFSKYDGLIGSADGLMDIIAPLSAQKLETYAACPFDFFMRYILSIREDDAVEEELDVEPRELGNIYHRILSRLLPLLVQKGLLSAAANPEAVDRLVDAHVTKETSGRLSGRIPALILKARQQHTARIVGRLIERERDTSISGFVPAHYEVTFGPRKDGGIEYPALALTIGPRIIDCVGRIDRIDINVSEAAFSVIDYKRKKGSGARKLTADILAGRHFQLPIYLMATDCLISKGQYRPGEGALVYLEADDVAKYRETISGEEFIQTRDTVIEQIGAVLDAIAEGEFTPGKGGSCRFCAHGDLCRSESKAVDTARRQKTSGGNDAPGEDDDSDES
jgi:ATP-dependent helicase/DNAse subunit B